MTSPNLYRRCFWLLLAVAVIWFGNIEYRKLIKPDEGRYAEIAREMVVNGDWVTPRLNDLKYFEKPPLQYWATATAYEVFGFHQWTARLWPALTGFAGVLLIWFVGARLFGNTAGLYAAMLLGGTQFYVLMAHINTLDMGVTFFLTLGISGLLLAQRQGIAARTRRNWMWLAWAALALAVLSKGLIGLVLPGAALFLYSVMQRDVGVWKRMSWGGGLLLFLLVAGPWFYLVMQANPEFFQKFIVYEHFTRFFTKELHRYQPWYYFVPVLLFGMMPWTFLMLDTVLRTWKDSPNVAKAFNPARYLLIWSVFVYVFFTISGSKLPSYILPIFPALALLMGKQLVEMTPRRLFWLLTPAALLALVVLGILPFIERFANNNPVREQAYSAYAWWLAAAALLWLIGSCAALLLLRRSRKMAAVLTLALSSLVAAQLAASGYNTIAGERSAYAIAEVIRPYLKPGIPLYSVRMYEQTLPFYLQRTVTLVDFQDELGFGIQQQLDRWVPDLPSLAKIWQTQPEALAIMELPSYPLLQQLGMDMKILYQDNQYIIVGKP
ncbi:MAG: glycosyltransferase family 39 protein [Gallionellaceae bacterium]|jgi:4-amino-4-deoxy-L-arabinose transferase-like glycosyltransferase|nr:glycosyltransferase family 39 protein [Gallionellaceae bacterium]